VVNTGLAFVLGERLPAVGGVAPAMEVGLLGYGFSLVLNCGAFRNASLQND
jgi:hypothetical protein